MILLNNAFPKTEFQAIKGLICSDSFPWFYTGTAYPNEVAGLEQYSWAHVAKNIDGWTSFICKPLEAMILNALGQVDGCEGSERKKSFLLVHRGSRISKRSTLWEPKS